MPLTEKQKNFLDRLYKTAREDIHDTANLLQVLYIEHDDKEFEPLKTWLESRSATAQTAMLYIDFLRGEPDA